MSVENVMKFRERVNGDLSLKRVILDAVRVGKGIDTIRLGEQHGFGFSAADVNAVFNRDDLELTDFELEVVSAGALQSKAGSCDQLVNPIDIAGQPKSQMLGG